METKLSTFRVHKIKTHQLHLLNSMVLWQFISKCLIIFIVQLNKDLIEENGLSWMRSTQSVLPDVDPRLKQHGFTSGRQGYSRALWWILTPGQGWAGLKRDTLYLHLYTKQAFGSTGQEDSVFHLKSMSAGLFSNWDPKGQLPHEHKNAQKALTVL